jgi:hypothetical protein
MDDDGVRDLINEVARHGERIGIEAPAPGARQMNEAKRPVASRRPGRGAPGRRPFAHSAAIAWFVGIAALVAAAVVLVGVPSSKPSHSQADIVTTTTTPAPGASTTLPAPSAPSQSQTAIARAVAETDSAGNFDLSFLLTGGTGMDLGDGMTGAGAADLDPIAMTLNHVVGATLSFGPDNAWEQLGPPGWQEYTIPAFSSYAEGVVGATAGALGTFSFCSPSGLFDLTQNSIGPTTEVGPASVDGQSTTEYAVLIDPASFLDAPGISSGEAQAIQSAISVLGSGSISDDVYINAAGDIVRTVSSIDGASLQVDLSNFGDAGTVTLPPQQSQIDSSTTPPGPINNDCPVRGSGGPAVSGVTTTTEPSTARSSTSTTIVCASYGGTVQTSQIVITTIPPPSSTTSTTAGN